MAHRARPPSITLPPTSSRDPPCAVSPSSACSCPRPASSPPTRRRPRKVVLLAGQNDKGPSAAARTNTRSPSGLLKHCLEDSSSLPDVQVEVHFHGWPRTTRPSTMPIPSSSSPAAPTGASRTTRCWSPTGWPCIDKQMKRGCGLVLIHWTTFFPTEKAGDKVLDWVGGYFDYQSGPPPQRLVLRHPDREHDREARHPDAPLCRGVEPFEVREEFYYKIRFREKDYRLDAVLSRPIPGEKSEQTVAWAVERKDGGRASASPAGTSSRTGSHRVSQDWSSTPSPGRRRRRGPEGRRGVGMPRRSGVARVTSAEADPRPDPHRARWPVPRLAGDEQGPQVALEQDDRVVVPRRRGPGVPGQRGPAAYDVIVQNYVNWQQPAARARRRRPTCSRYLQAGRGLAVIHFANGAFHFSLPARRNPTGRSTARSSAASGTTAAARAATTRSASSASRSPREAPDHEGMTDFDTIDELYFRQAGDRPIVPLVVANSKNTGKDEPLAWAYDYDKGRVFQTLLGHAAGRPRRTGRRADPPRLRLGRGRADAEAGAVPEGRTACRRGASSARRSTPASRRLVFEGNDRYRKPPLTVECWAKLNSKRGFNVLVASDPKSSAQHWEIYSYAGSGVFSAYLPGMSRPRSSRRTTSATANGTTSP